MVVFFDLEHDWLLTLITTTEIRPYMYETLMYLVSIHAQITCVSDGLLERTLTYLVTQLADEALRCFRQVKRFGMGGMLRVRLFSIHRDFHSPSLFRQLSKSSLCTKLWANTYRNQPLLPWRSFTPRFLSLMHVGLVMRISKTI